MKKNWLPGVTRTYHGLLECRSWIPGWVLQREGFLTADGTDGRGFKRLRIQRGPGLESGVVFTVNERWQDWQPLRGRARLRGSKLASGAESLHALGRMDQNSVSWN